MLTAINVASVLTAINVAPMLNATNVASMLTAINVASMLSAVNIASILSEIQMCSYQALPREILVASPLSTHWPNESYSTTNHVNKYLCYTHVNLL